MSKNSVSYSNPNDLSAYWMPFTANRQFKKNPRMFIKAKDMYYTSSDGRSILDSLAGLWCVNAGHCRDHIADEVSKQVRELDYSTAFQMGHPKIFELSSRLVQMMPEGIDHVFFGNSGSEAVETALKVALAYQKLKGQGSRTRLIGRERGYHGVNFGGISVGGMVYNRKMFGGLLGGVDHIRHTHDIERNAFSRGQPLHGKELAEDLERLVQLHDPSTIAALIVEPLSGSAGVLIPPIGYLERLREICDKYGILLIFDEVITGFGRTGKAFASELFSVTPDIITVAKALTNGTIPMGATFVKKEIYDTFMQGQEHIIELFHGYTYSGHPVAAAASMAALDIYQEEGLFERASELSGYWEDAVHSMKGLPHVIDIRNIGMVSAIELEPIDGSPGKRGFGAFIKAFEEEDCLIRTTGDTIAFSPPLIIEKKHIDILFGKMERLLRKLD